MIRVLTFFLVFTLCPAGVAPAPAQDIRINPVPPHVKPRWAPVPGTPGVDYAPNLPTDLFRYRRKYYFFWSGYFYQGSKPGGPWKSMQQVPPVFYDIDPAYFKTVKQEGTAVPTGTGKGPKMLETPPPAEVTPGAPPETESAPAAPEKTGPPPKIM